MTAPETFADLKETLDKGRRPDRFGWTSKASVWLRRVRFINGASYTQDTFVQ